MKLLNIDEIAVSAKKGVEIAGKTYPVQQQSVGAMLAAIEMAEEAEAVASKDMSDKNLKKMLQNIVNTVKSIIPTCPEEIINKLQFEQLLAVINFVNSSEAESAAESDGVETEVNAEGK